jgi:hypothetical protein
MPGFMVIGRQSPFVPAKAERRKNSGLLSKKERKQIVKILKWNLAGLY